MSRHRMLFSRMLLESFISHKYFGYNVESNLFGKEFYKDVVIRSKEYLFLTLTILGIGIIKKNYRSIIIGMTTGVRPVRR